MSNKINNKDELDAKLAEIGDGVMVMLEFHANWCGNCKKIAPKLEQLLKEFKDIHFFTIDVDVSEDLVAAYNIKSMPTFVIIKNKNIVDTYVGSNSDEVKNLIIKNK
ncbi:hypothetical protein L9F63_000619 [Diploptera punctata]|uniref:Thioredoxin domain-containing protein n=1 Tax=Diploptera punctata TaxID=6984 RepID=A0AAD8AL97_DIPPU|nr:hypothetical protein L9F63_000619 [Diploptera punctata]